MRAVPIPDAAIWPGAERIVMGPPGGNLDSEVSALEMLADVIEVDGAPVQRYLAMCHVTPAEVEALGHGGHVWVSFVGLVVPFDVNVTDANGVQIED